MLFMTIYKLTFSYAAVYRHALKVVKCCAWISESAALRFFTSLPTFKLRFLCPSLLPQLQDLIVRSMLNLFHLPSLIISCLFPAFVHFHKVSFIWMESYGLRTTNCSFICDISSLVVMVTEIVMRGVYKLYQALNRTGKLNDIECIQ